MSTPPTLFMGYGTLYFYLLKQQKHHQLFYGNYTDLPVSTGTTISETEDFAEAKFYCLHAMADGN